LGAAEAQVLVEVQHVGHFHPSKRVLQVQSAHKGSAAVGDVLEQGLEL
jgi:hypothetical protein